MILFTACKLLSFFYFCHEANKIWFDSYDSLADNQDKIEKAVKIFITFCYWNKGVLNFHKKRKQSKICCVLLPFSHGTHCGYLKKYFLKWVVFWSVFLAHRGIWCGFRNLQYWLYWGGPPGAKLFGFFPLPLVICVLKIVYLVENLIAYCL